MSARPALGTTQPREGPTPYGRPVIKSPTWTWEIPAYFYTGGLAGASAGLSRLAEARGNDALARRASFVALGGAVASPALLISDLGRPARFLHMLRMFKVTSPMSVGSWILAGFGTLTGAGALDHALGGTLPVGRAARTAAALLGLPLSSYTAALVANTAVPAWHESRMILPFVFASGAAASAGGALTALTPVEDAAPARRLAVVGAAAELVFKETMEHRLGELSDAYKEGAAHRYGVIARTLIALGGATILLGGRRSRRSAAAGGALLNAGALAARWSVYKAGFQSAENPRHTVGPQRARIASGATRGASTRDRPAGAVTGRGTPGRSEAVAAGRPASEAEPAS
jgi:formate-dependent nitrite reductase membrane component NrfD